MEPAFKAMELGVVRYVFYSCTDICSLSSVQTARLEFLKVQIVFLFFFLIFTSEYLVKKGTL